MPDTANSFDCTNAAAVEPTSTNKEAPGTVSFDFTTPPSPTLPNVQIDKNNGELTFYLVVDSENIAEKVVATINKLNND